MSDPSPLAEAVEGYVELARWWIGEVGGDAEEVGRRIDAGTFDANAAMAAAARCGALSVLGGAALANEFLDATSIISRPPSVVRTVKSGRIPAPAAQAGARVQPRPLTLKQPLRCGFGDSIPVNRVKIVPAALVQEPTFRLEATITGDPAGVYTGTVWIAAGGAETGLPVWLIVP